MKELLLAASVAMALASFAGQANAACASPSVRVVNLNTLLRGNTACVPTSIGGVKTWQELHVNGGDLIDYKRGPGHKIDPSEKVGTWLAVNSTTPNAVVTYNYTGGQSYTYQVWRNSSGTYSFCAPGKEVVARIKTGGGSC